MDYQQFFHHDLYLFYLLLMHFYSSNVLLLLLFFPLLIVLSLRISHEHFQLFSYFHLKSSVDVWIFFSWPSYLSPYVGWETNHEMIFFLSKKYKEEIAYKFSIFIWIQLVATKPVTSCFKQEKNYNCNAKYTWILYMCFRCEYSVYTCLLIIIEVNRTRCKRPPLFIYLRKWLLYMCFHFEYSVYICLLITIDVNRSKCKRPPVFVYLCKTVCWHVLSL